MTGTALRLLAVVAALGAPAARADDLDARIGAELFRRVWVPAPASTRAADGLGPLFNAPSCVACHRGLARTPPTGRRDDIAREALVLRLSDAEGRPDPVYGVQLQTRSVGAAPVEAQPRHGADGTVGLRKLGYGPLAPATRVGARTAPALRGLGLLEQVPEDAVIAIAAEQAASGTGIAGRPAWIDTGDGARRLGRFGSKASAATLVQQTELAFSTDLGLSTPGRPDPAGDCTPAQAACRTAPHGGTAATPEIAQAIVERIAHYLARIAPPPPPPPDPEGARLFAAVGCATCHRPELPVPGGRAAAFTDLLLHDLGPGLDGGATEPGVAPTEWRTAPLWGLSRALAAGAGLLHDGRARTVAEAIRRHGGTAAGVRVRYDALSTADRRRLLAFVGGL